MRIAAFFAVVAWMSALNAADWNAAVLRAVAAMPSGGGYSVSSEAGEALRASTRVSRGQLVVDARSVRPSYCSGATYLVLLSVVAEAQRKGEVRLSEASLQKLLPAQQRDGNGVWGRWNANGPGTARLFHELGLGRNFTSYEDARPGDFLKIFWRDAVGKYERGHLVVYLGSEQEGGVEMVRFWSSNKPGGFGAKRVPKSQIARALFSRLENPGNLRGIETLKPEDSYLAGLLERESSFAEACRLSGAE